MNVLFISEDLVAGNISRLLLREGHNVRLHIRDAGRKNNFSGLVKKIDDWKSGLSFIKSDDLIIFDSSSDGNNQDLLRKKGFSVVGGSAEGDKIERDRNHCSSIFSNYRLNEAPLYNFKTALAAAKFVAENRKKWVIKQNASGTGLKSLNYVGQLDSGEDTINLLIDYQDKKYKGVTYSLQEKIDGVEIGVGRYFNGNDWVGPIEINLEHKKLFPGDLGPTTSEMGTLAWYTSDEKNRLFQETLAKIKPFLKQANFRGDMEINCIINQDGAFPLEATPRFGSPIVHLQSEIHQSPWGEFLKAVADGKPFDLKWKKGFGIVVVVTVPTSNPFPFTKAESYVSPKGLNIYFREDFTEEDMKHVHFEDVSVKRVKGKKQYYISDDRGYVLYVTGMGKTVEEARKKTYKIIEKIIIPKMFYRNDIGLKFIERDQAKLKKWGYL